MVPQSQPQANQGRPVQGAGGFIFDLGVIVFLAELALQSGTSLIDRDGQPLTDS